MYSFENVAIFKFLSSRQIDVFNWKIMQSLFTSVYSTSVNS